MPFPSEPRPKREDIPAECDPADVLYELRLLGWEWRLWRNEVNGDMSWLRRHRMRATEWGRAALVVLPVIIAALLTLHILGGP